MASNESQLHIAILLIIIAPCVSIAAGIFVGGVWKFHWLGLAVGLNLLTLLIPLTVSGYAKAWVFLFACSGIASAVTYCNCRRPVGKVRSWLIGTSSVNWSIIGLVAQFMLDPNGAPSRTIPWSPVGVFLLFGAVGATVACVFSTLFGLIENKT